ncbi:MAG: helix-turn-helix transcriptional regulator [Tannerella sp.]|nr:helix-turn-helix transcriptional regulator [Tannerella sp.]
MIQIMLFDEIRKRLKPAEGISDVVGELLGVSVSAAYRRINGNKVLTILELEKLCAEFGVSFDELMQTKTGNVTFRYHPADIENLDNYRNYISEITGMISTMSRQGNGEILYSAEDIPLFHFLRCPELAFFKVYSWFIAVSGIKISFERFMDDIEERDSLYKNFKNLENSYLDIPSAEVWTNNTIDHILSALQYADGMGVFEKRETLALLFSQLSSIIENIEKWAENGKKDNRGEFKWFYSAVNPENNFMLMKNGAGCVVAIRLYAVKNIFTSNRAFCAETEKWIRSIMDKSQLISGSSAKERFSFVQNQQTKIDGLRTRLLDASM